MVKFRGPKLNHHVNIFYRSKHHLNIQLGHLWFYSQVPETIISLIEKVYTQNVHKRGSTIRLKVGELWQKVSRFQSCTKSLFLSTLHRSPYTCLCFLVVTNGRIASRETSETFVYTFVKHSGITTMWLEEEGWDRGRGRRPTSWVM